MKYNHAYTIAFSIDTDNPPDKVTAKELLNGLYERLVDLQKCDDEIIEAVGMPFDTYENEDAPDKEKKVKEVTP